METVCRCGWCNLRNPLYVQYHDEEWGMPQRDDQKLFELLVLESFQAGLSWETILNKREAFRAAFGGFDPERVAAYGEEAVTALLGDKSIVRNRPGTDLLAEYAGIRRSRRSGDLLPATSGTLRTGRWSMRRERPARRCRTRCRRT